MTNEEVHLAGPAGRARCGVEERLYVDTDAARVGCKACLRAEVKRLRALMPEVYGDGYQAGVDGDESDVLEVRDHLDKYLAALPPR